jgi:hypothetical protein
MCGRQSTGETDMTITAATTAEANSIAAQLRAFTVTLTGL